MWSEASMVKAAECTVFEGIVLIYYFENLPHPSVLFIMGGGGDVLIYYFENLPPPWSFYNGGGGNCNNLLF